MEKIISGKRKIELTEIFVKRILLYNSEYSFCNFSNDFLSLCIIVRRIKFLSSDNLLSILSILS
jgi:hypothetical protein